jgi:acyl carrier protein
MTPEQLRSMLKTIINEESGINIDRLTPEYDLIQHGGMDSLDSAAVLFRIETQLGIHIPFETVQQARTFGQLEASIHQLLIQTVPERS